jgi:hypothetical protein
MQSPKVANDLNRLVMGVHLLTNLGELDMIRFLFGVKRIKHEHGIYRVADFGKAIATRVKDSPLADLFQLPSSAGLTHITFGPVGDWFIVCSQQAMFKQCLAVANDPDNSLTQWQDDQLIPLNDTHDQLLVSGISRIADIAPLVNDAADYWRISGMREKSGPYDAPLQWLASVLRHRRALQFQLWRTSDNTLRGRLDVLGP